MRKSLLALLALLFWMSWPQPATAQEASPTPEARSSSAVETPTPGGTELPGSPTPVVSGISDPKEGAILSGQVAISGVAANAWDLSFAYKDDATGTWFPLASGSAPVTGVLLPAWDTTAITDGFYTLRLRIFPADAAQEFTVNIRILNYSALETATPIFTPTVTATFTPPPPTPLPSFTPTVTYTPAPPPTPLPPNPASLNPNEIAVNFGKGALGVTAIFAFFGLLLFISKKLRS